jgi:molybdate transport system ATP-binding protein
LITLRVRKRLIGAEGPFELDVELTVPKGQLTVLSGASGAGKTTLLRMLAGLTHPDEGCIKVDGELWFNARVCVPPQRRSIGFVFQDYALFPSMTVRRNLEFASSRRKDARVNMLLAMVELEELQHRYPADLSGGQQQRVALARALVRQPKILLLDEPLSALDEAMRERLQEEIVRLHRELRLTTIFVSHDRSEILRLADRVIMLDEGRVAFDGPPSHAYRDDQNRCSSRLSAEIVEVFNDNGSVAIVAVTGGGSVQIEIRVDEPHLRQLLDKGVASPKSAPGNPS